ncbi:MAG: RHS repeat protein [Anaerolineae bacterium]|nr:RHS repeat protein [Anaerolineae bacterium]
MSRCGDTRCQVSMVWFPSLLETISGVKLKDGRSGTTRRLDGSQDVTLTYDAENRLIGISGGGVTASYVYDADGNRVKETIGPIFGHELHESKRRQKLDSCKLVKFVAEKAGRILATNDTN